MGSHAWVFTELRHNLASKMSWTWRGFWRDDPVFRFKNESFFQSGRHKAEERFWVTYIHNDGSYTRHSSTPSYNNEEHVKESNSDQDKESLTEPIIDKETPAETLEAKNINENKIGDGVIKRESKEYEEKSAALTCLSCSKCSQPLGWVEKERYVSR